MSDNRTCCVAGQVEILVFRKSGTADSTQFVFFGRLLVEKFFVKKFFESQKTRNLAPLPSFLALEELFHKELLPRACYPRHPKLDLGT